MHRSLRFPFAVHTALFVTASVAVFVGACGGNVVVDGPPTPTGGSTTSTTTSLDTTGTVPASTTGFGDSTTTGFGGSTTTGFGASTATGFGASTTAVTSTTNVSVSVSSSTGTGPGGACIDGPDGLFLDGKLLYPVMVTCAEQNLGNLGGEEMCIQAQTGLSPGCAFCVASDIECSISQCQSPCVSGPDSTNCIQCRAGNCAAPWVQCSGFSNEPGSLTCEIELLAGTKGTGWQSGLPAEAFVTQQAYQSYELLDNCACNQMAANTCAKFCDQAITAGPLNFCNAAQASPACLMCLESTCNARFMSCTGS